MGDLGVVEEAAQRARDALDWVVEHGRDGSYLADAYADLAQDVLALVADREALLERVRQLEETNAGGGTAAVCGGDA